MLWLKRGVRLHLIAALVIVVSACTPRPPSSPDADVEPRNPDASGWRFAAVVDQHKSADECGPAAFHAKPPILAGIKAYGLESRLYWMPGGAMKVNWVDETNPASTGSKMTLILERPNDQSSTFRLSLAPNPSSISFPGPGCWSLTVNWRGETGTTLLAVPAAQPTSLMTTNQLEFNDMPDDARMHRNPKLVLDLLDAVSRDPQDLPDGREVVPFFIVWETTQGPLLTPALYFPASRDAPPLVALGRNLVTGDCHHSPLPVAAPLPNSLASRLETELAGGLHLTSQQPRPWQRKGSDCEPFVPGPPR